MTASTDAAAMVDHAFDYVNASPTYRANNRDRMIRELGDWAAFERAERERLAHKAACLAIAPLAQTIAGVIGGVVEPGIRRKAA